MHIALLCATRRGNRVLRRLCALAPDARFTVVSFRELPWEPPYLSEIERTAKAYGAAFHEDAKLEGRELRHLFESDTPDVMLCVNWRRLVPAAIFSRVRQGAYVMHDSLLPRYRGFSPVVWAMINGETESGVTLFRMAGQFDRGDIVDQQRVTIGRDDYIGDVTERITDACIEVLERNLADLLAGMPTTRPQDESQATYTCRLLPEDMRLDWEMDARSVFNRIRAYSTPYPGAYTWLEGQKLYILRARVPETPRRYVSRMPGRVVHIDGESTFVLTGSGPLEVLQVRLEDGPPMPASALLARLSQTLGV